MKTHEQMFIMKNSWASFKKMQSYSTDSDLQLGQKGKKKSAWCIRRSSYLKKGSDRVGESAVQFSIHSSHLVL
jgi:hypothetical protein